MGGALPRPFNYNPMGVQTHDLILRFFEKVGILSPSELEETKLDSHEGLRVLYERYGVSSLGIAVYTEVEDGTRILAGYRIPKMAHDGFAVYLLWLNTQWWTRLIILPVIFALHIWWTGRGSGGGTGEGAI